MGRGGYRQSRMSDMNGRGYGWRLKNGEHYTLCQL